MTFVNQTVEHHKIQFWTYEICSTNILVDSTIMKSKKSKQMNPLCVKTETIPRAPSETAVFWSNIPVNNIYVVNVSLDCCPFYY